MSVQRKRGQKAEVWPTVSTTDARGNHVRSAVPITDPPIWVTAAFIPQRSGRAEVAGQAQINVTRMICDPNLEGVDLWSIVRWAGKLWDVAAPPAYHHGTRGTRHWGIDIRERPS